jgi:hypothetical protein
MSNTPAMCNSFKNELLNGQHNFGVGYVRTTSADTFKMALYVTTASINNSTAAYSATNEVSGTGYSAGGATVTNAAVPALFGAGAQTACWTPSAPVSWSGLTLSTAFDTALLYNSTNANKAVASYGIGAQTITAGTLTLTMPTQGAGTALINIA